MISLIITNFIHYYICINIYKGGDNLAIEAIKSIKECEQRGNEVIAKAQAEAKDIIKKAKMDGDNMYEEILKQAKDEKNRILSNAEEEGKNMANPIIARCEDEIKSYSNINGEKLDKAVKLIYERIVRSHGNN